MHIDLLPYELHRRRRVVSALRAWLIAGAICVGLFTLTYGIENGRLQSVSDAVDQRESQFQPIVTKRTEIREILKQLEILKSREATAYALEDRHPALTLVAAIGNAASKTEGKLNIKTLTFNRSRDEEGVVTMNGQAVDHLGMAKFLAALRVSNLFASVDPKWVKANDNGQWTIQNFEIECLF